MLCESIPKLRHESTDFPEVERFDRWQDVIGGSFDDVTPGRSAREDAAFWVQSSMWNFGQAVLSSSTMHGRQIKQRGANRIRADHLDHYRIQAQRAGTECCDAEGRRSVVRPGNVLITDMSREQRCEALHSERDMLIVPREMLDEALPRPMDLHGALLDDAGARLLARHLAAMADGADGVAAVEAPLLMAATVQLIAGALAGSRDSRLDAAPAVAPSLLRQMCRYIDLNLADPQLGSEALCTRFDTSRTSLYRLFGPLGGVSGFIRERRLQRVHEALRAGGKRINLARLASDHGFVSSSHFSRAFRDQFGYSPSDVQRLGGGAQAATSHPALAARAAGASADTLSEWLRALRD